MLTENVYYSERPKQFYLYPYDGARMCRADFPVDVTKIGTEEDKQYLCNVYSLRTAYFESLEKDIESDYKTWLERAKEYTEARKHMMLKSILRATNSDDAETRTYTTDLGQTVYGGTLDVVSGELNVEWVKIKMSDLTWEYNTSHDYPYFESRGITGALNTLGSLTCACSVYEAVTNRSGGNWYSEFPNKIAFNSSSSGARPYLRVQDPTITSASDFMAMLQTTDADLAYELATPQTIQLTPQEIRLLVGDNTIWSDGKVELEYSADVTKWLMKKLNS